MKLPWTAKDDQPGPTGFRQSSVGGDAVQSVAIRTPPTTPSRAGPRNPGQRAAASPRGAAVGRGGGAPTDGAALGFPGLSAAGVGVRAGDGRAAGSRTAWAISRSSELFDQRQPNVAAWSPLMPSVRTSVQTPHESKSAAAIASRL